MGLFDFLKPRKETVSKPVKNDGLNEFQRKQLFNLIEEIMDMEVIINHDEIQNTTSRDFIKKFSMDLLSHKDPEFDEFTWIQEPGLLFEDYNSNDKADIIEKLEPVRNAIEKYLKSVVSNYDGLIEAVQRHKKMSKEYMDARRAGGHVNQDRKFIGNWMRNIGKQWYNLAHLICEFDNELDSQFSEEKNIFSKNENFDYVFSKKYIENLGPSKLPILLEGQLREFVAGLIKDDPHNDSPFGGMYIMKIVSNWSESMKEAGLEDTFDIPKSQVHKMIDQVSKKVLNELVEF